MSFFSALDDFITTPDVKLNRQKVILQQAAIDEAKSRAAAQAQLLGTTDPYTGKTYAQPQAPQTGYQSLMTPPQQPDQTMNPGARTANVQIPDSLMGNQPPQPGGLMGGPEQFAAHQQQLRTQADPDYAMQMDRLAPMIASLPPEMQAQVRAGGPKALETLSTEISKKYADQRYPTMPDDIKMIEAAKAKIQQFGPGTPEAKPYEDLVASKTYNAGTDPLKRTETQASIDEKKSQIPKNAAEAKVAEARAKALSDNNISDDAVEFRAQLALAGDQTGAFSGLPTGVYGSGARAKITERWEKLATEAGVSGDEMSKIRMQRSAANAALTQVSKRAGIADYNANELAPLAKQLEDASKAVDRVGWTDINDLTNFAKSHTSNPEYGALDVAVQGYKTAFTQALSRNGVPTDAGRAKADKLFSGARNHSDLMARVAQANKEAGAVVEAGETTKKQILQGAPGGSRSAPAATVMPPNIQSLIDQYAPRK